MKTFILSLLLCTASFSLAKVQLSESCLSRSNKFILNTILPELSEVLSNAAKIKVSDPEYANYFAYLIKDRQLYVKYLEEATNAADPRGRKLTPAQVKSLWGPISGPTPPEKIPELEMEAVGVVKAVYTKAASLLQDKTADKLIINCLTPSESGTEECYRGELAYPVDRTQIWDHHSLKINICPKFFKTYTASANKFVGPGSAVCKPSNSDKIETHLAGSLVHIPLLEAIIHRYVGNLVHAPDMASCVTGAYWAEQAAKDSMWKEQKMVEGDGRVEVGPIRSAAMGNVGNYIWMAIAKILKDRCQERTVGVYRQAREIKTNGIKKQPMGKEDDWVGDRFHKYCVPRVQEVVKAYKIG